MPSNHLILCHPLLLLPSIFPNIRVFSNESALHIRCPEYWSFASVSVLPKNIQDWFPLRLTGLISFLSKGLSRGFSSTTASILQCSAFFMVQFWHLYMKVKSESESEVPQLCPTLCDPMDYSLPGSSIRGILQARIPEWVAISFSRRYSQPRDRTLVSNTASRCFTIWATKEALYMTTGKIIGVTNYMDLFWQTDISAF